MIYKNYEVIQRMIVRLQTILELDDTLSQFSREHMNDVVEKLQTVVNYEYFDTDTMDGYKSERTG